MLRALHRLRLAETIKFGGNPPDVWPQVNAAAAEAEGENPSEEPFAGTSASLCPSYQPYRQQTGLAACTVAACCTAGCRCTACTQPQVDMILTQPEGLGRASCSW